MPFFLRHKSRYPTPAPTHHYSLQKNLPLSTFCPDGFQWTIFEDAFHSDLLFLSALFDGFSATYGQALSLQASKLIQQMRRRNFRKRTPHWDDPDDPDDPDNQRNGYGNGQSTYSFRDPAAYSPPPFSLSTPYIITGVPPTKHDSRELRTLSAAISDLRLGGQYLVGKGYTNEANIVSGWVNQLEASYIAVKGMIAGPTSSATATETSSPPQSTKASSIESDAEEGTSTLVQTRTRPRSTSVSSPSSALNTDSISIESSSKSSLPPIFGTGSGLPSRPIATGSSSLFQSLASSRSAGSIAGQDQANATGPTSNNTKKYLAIGGGVAGGVAILLAIVWLLWRRSRTHTHEEMDYDEYGRQRLQNNNIMREHAKTKSDVAHQQSYRHDDDHYANVTDFNDHDHNRFVDMDADTTRPLSTVYKAPSRALSDTTRANTRAPSASYAPSAAAVSTNFHTQRQTGRSSFSSASHSQVSAGPSPSTKPSGSSGQLSGLKSKQLRFKPPQSAKSAKSNGGDFASLGTRSNAPTTFNNPEERQDPFNDV